MLAMVPTFPFEVWLWWGGVFFVGLVVTTCAGVLLWAWGPVGCDCPRCAVGGRHAAPYDPAKDPREPVDYTAWVAEAEAEYERLLEADDREAADRG